MSSGEKKPEVDQGLEMERICLLSGLKMPIEELRDVSASVL